MIKSDCRLIGSLVKLHGFKGRFILVLDLVEEIENWESVFIEIDGLLVPFFIDFINLTSDSSAVIGFEDIDNPDKGKEFVSCNVFQTVELAGEEKMVPDELKGYNVIDKKVGLIGILYQVLDYNHNVLLRVLNGNDEILIPANCVVKVNQRKKDIIISAPDGLIELNKKGAC